MQKANKFKTRMRGHLRMDLIMNNMSSNKTILALILVMYPIEYEK